jgi:hypothetical protein
MLMNQECLHAPPEPGRTISPCCGRGLDQLPPYDRITLDPDQVTCGRLTPMQELMLSGQPVITDPHHEQVAFAMATTVAALSNGTVALPDALARVNDAIRELVPPDQPLRAWTSPMMVSVTARAQQLALS